MGWYILCVVKRLRKKLYKCGITPPQLVYIVGPVYQQATPYHYRKHRKINPVKPPDGKWMFVNDPFQK